MQRDLNRLANEVFDLVVVGGGVYGASIARDAALRGLSVALIEQRDFGHATSANSLKIIHGGLRYVQDFRPDRVRMMHAERGAWRRIAPHLVHDLPCVLPAFDQWSRGRTALALALALNQWMAAGARPPADGLGTAPLGRLLSPAECLSLVPGLSPARVTGAALWHDAQIYNSERLLLALVLSAAAAGAAVANYVQAAEPIMRHGDVVGVRARDALSGQPLEIRSRMVINSTGAWTDAFLRPLGGSASAPRFPLSLAVNLVTRQILPQVAVGLPAVLPGQNGTGARAQILFIVPWRNYSLIGTAHRAHTGAPEALAVSEALIEGMLAAVNRAYPPAVLQREDVRRVHAGFLPLAPGDRTGSRLRLLREGRVHDHWREERIGGLITVVGVKYTAARKVAEQAVDLAVERLGRPSRPCQTGTTPVWGGAFDLSDDGWALFHAGRQLGLFADTLDGLIHCHGSETERLLDYVRADPAWGAGVTPLAPVIWAEVVHAVRAEMACTLADVILRRTELAADGPVDDRCLEACAALMGAELGWAPARAAQEIADARAALQALTAGALVPLAMS
jgi:glycerol-3-phosphate dehydrogenase